MIKAPQDFWAGLVFGAVGLLILVVAWNYPTGTGSQMSYGYFPRLLGFALCTIAVAIVVRSVAERGPPIPRVGWRPLLPLGGVVTFGLLLKPAGLLLASFALIAVSVVATERFRAFDIVLLAVLLIPFNWLVFVWALGLPPTTSPRGMRLWRS